MSRTALALGAACWLALATICGIVLALASCAPPEPEELRIRGSERLTPEALAHVAKALPHMPTDPWPCVRLITLDDDATEIGHGYYHPDAQSIRTTAAALAHELAHAAGECAGDYDPGHLAGWWREVDAR